MNGVSSRIPYFRRQKYLISSWCPMNCVQSVSAHFSTTSAIAVLGSPATVMNGWPDCPACRPRPYLPTGSGIRLKIVMFLRKSNFTTFWEEVSEVIGMICCFSRSEIGDQASHPRWLEAAANQRILPCVDMPNVSVAADNVHSIQLMNWADVIIDLATSVVFEAVKAKNRCWRLIICTRAAPPWLNYMPETELKCRDDVYGESTSFFPTAVILFMWRRHRQRFIEEMLHAGGRQMFCPVMWRCSRRRRRYRPESGISLSKKSHSGCRSIRSCEQPCILWTSTSFFEQS